MAATPSPARAQSCVLCGSTAFRLYLAATDYLTLESFPIVCCRDCELCRLDPAFAPDDLATYYPPAYYGDGGLRFAGPLEWFVKQFRFARVRRILDGDPPGRLLDVGCGRGWELSEVRRLGWQVHGTERDEGAVRFARETLGLDVQCRELAACAFPEQSFDIVTLWHVLEHLPDPMGTMREVHRILRPSGKVVIAVPNLGGWQARMTGRHWFHLDVPRHLFHFTRKTLTRLLGAIGFDLIREHHFSAEFDPFGLAQSLLNAMRFSPNLLFSFMKQPGQLWRARRDQRVALTAALVIGAPLLAASSVASVAASLARAGGTMEFHARKP